MANLSVGVYRKRWDYAVRKRAFRIFPSKVAVGASIPGLEYSSPENRLHYLTDENRNHYSTDENRVHYKVRTE